MAHNGVPMIRFTFFKYLFLLSFLSCLLVAEDQEVILTKHAEAMGGLERIRSFKTIKTEGVVFMHQTKIGYTFWATETKCRIDLDMNGVRSIQLFDGATGWGMNARHQNGQPHRLNAFKTRRLRNHLDFQATHLVDWQRKGHRVTYLGLETIEGKPYHKFDVLTSLHFQKTYFLDPETFLTAYYRDTLYTKDHEAMLTEILDYTWIDGAAFKRSFVTGSQKQCEHSKHEQPSQCGFYLKVITDATMVNIELEDHIFEVEAAQLLIAENQ